MTTDKKTILLIDDKADFIHLAGTSNGFCRGRDERNL
jgi:hypothetical protein